MVVHLVSRVASRRLMQATLRYIAHRAQQRRQPSLLLFSGALALLAMACSNDSERLAPAVGTLAVSVRTTGTDVDADGYVITVGTTARPAAPATGASSATTVFDGLALGTHTVTLTGVAANCTVTGENPRAVALTAAAAPVPVEFAVTCTHPPQLAFSSDRAGTMDLWLINADGTGLRQLTSDAGRDYLPTWSPSGDRLAFTSNRDGNDEIVVMNADGSGRVNLTQHAAFDSHPVWSPDGSRIAFLSDRDGVASGGSVSGRSLDVFVMDADGGNLVRLGDFTSGNESSSWSWSPDGRYIVLVRHSSPCCYSDLYIANVSTGAATLFAPPGGVRYDFDPIWSPDGTRIAFDRYEGCSRLFSARVDGSDLRELTPGRCRSVEPQWSAGGGQPIVFRQAGEIFVMAADGSGVRSVSGSPRAGDTAPQWSPDGSALAFDSVRDGNYEVYVVSADGTGLRNLTQSPGNDYLARWRPGATPAAPSVPGGGTP